MYVNYRMIIFFFFFGSVPQYIQDLFLLKFLITPLNKISGAATVLCPWVLLLIWLSDFEKVTFWCSQW